MSNKTIIIFVIVLLILGVGLGVFLSSGASVSVEPKLQEQKAPGIEQSRTGSTSTKVPTPTFPPFDLTVKEISPTYFILNNKKGGILKLTRTKTKIFKRVKGKLIEAKESDVKMGLGVTVQIVKPGVEAHLIIEQ